MDMLNVSIAGGNNETENESFVQINRSDFGLNIRDSDSCVSLWIIVCNVLVLTASACINFVFMLVLLCSRRNGNSLILII